jgi:hypothetical protein
MRSILRALVLAPAMIAAAALATTSAMAESTVNVPFSFTVAGKHCPAGQYTIQRDPIHSFVTLRSKYAPVGFNWILGPGDGVARDSNIRLSFAVQDQSYALDSVQFGSQTTSQSTRHLNKSPRTEHKQIVTIPGE